MGKRVDGFMDGLRDVTRYLKRGFVSEVQKDAGHGDGYLSRIFSGRRKAPDSETVFSILAHPQIDARRLLEAAGVDLVFSPVPYLAQIPHGDNPDPQLEKLERAVEQLSTSELTSQELLDRLKGIDDLRFSDPRAATLQLDALLQESLPASTKTLAAMLASYAEDRRSRMKRGLAARALQIGLEVSKGGATKAEVQCLQRCSYLFVNQGLYSVAECCSAKAVDLALRYVDQETTARMLCTDGMVQFYQGNFSKSLVALKASQRYSSGHDWIYSYSVQHAMAGCHAYMDSPSVALEHLALAEGLHRTRKGRNWFKLFWLRGDVEWFLRNYESAEKNYRLTLKGFSEEHDPDPIYISLIYLSICRIMVLDGRSREIDEVAKCMVPLLISTESNRVASAAILAFYNESAKGKVTVDFIEYVMNTLEKSRRQS